MRNSILKKYKSVFIFVTVLFIFISGGLIVSASAQARLVDNAGLLTDSQSSSILSNLNSLSNQYNCDVVIVTENGYEPNIQDRADLLLESYSSNGILLYINMYDRDWAVSTYGSCIDIFSDRRLNTLCDNFLNRLSANDYNGAFNSFISDSGYYLSLGPDVGDKMSMPAKIGLSLGIGLVIALIVTMSWRAKLLPVKLAYNANNYAHDMNITTGNERFIRSAVTKMLIQSSNNSRGGGGSSTHISSSGGMHGGRSGKF